METSVDQKASPPKETPPVEKPVVASGSKIKAARKPYPWPFFLTLLLPAVFLGLLAWELNEKNYTMCIRIGWDAMCSFIPGISIMILLGSLAQFRRRPVLSFISLAFSSFYLGGAYWVIQKILQYHWLN